MPKPIERWVYECEWCDEEFWDELECAKHEMTCRHRPKQATYQDRICVFCIHWSLFPGFDPAGETTPGMGGDIKCDKGVWRMHEHGDEVTYRNYIKSAETCPMFEVVRGYEHLFPDKEE